MNLDLSWSKIIVKEKKKKFDTELYQFNDLSFLIAVLLSQQTKDSFVNRFSLNLLCKKDYLICRMSDEDIYKSISRINLYKKKAITIKEVIKEYRISKENIYKYERLISIKGIGKKTASVFLYSVNVIKGVAVDTHVTRVFNRVCGLKITPEKISNHFEKSLEKKVWPEVNSYLVAHGRRICLAKQPKCKLCVLKNYCQYFLKTKKEA